MNIQQNDIIVRTFQNTPTLWVSERFICKELGDNLSDYLWKIGRTNYKKTVSPCHQSKDILPATGKSWRYARINGQFYYDYDFIPDRKDTQFRSRLGDRDTLLHAVDNAVAKEIEMSRKEAESYMIQVVTDCVNRLDIDHFRFVKIDGVCKYNLDMAKQLAEGLSWLRVVQRMINNKQFRELGFTTQKDFFELCGSILDRRKLYGFLISTGGSLRKKLIYFPVDEDEQREYMISARWGNDNARKIGKCKLVDTDTGEIKKFDIHEALILKLWMNIGGSAKESKIALFGKYEQSIARLNEKPISYSTFCHFTNMYDTRLKTYKERHGWQAFAKEFLTYIPSESLRYANSLWCADGSGTLAYRYIDQDGKLRSMRLYIIMVTDVATGKVVGWYPAECGQHKETPEMVRKAVLMGLEGCNHKEIMEFVSDNHGAFTSTESKIFLQQVCRKVRTIEPGNSQANYAETQFRLFKKMLRDEFNWLGSSWDSKDIENTANEDYINIKTFPTYNEVIAQIEQKIECWNNELTHAKESRTELYAEGIHPDAQELDDRVWRQIAGNYTKQEITRQRTNIVIEKAGIKHMFEIPDVDSISEVIRDYLGYAALVETRMYWDEEYCDVYTLDNRFMFTCFAALKTTTSHAEANDKTIQAQGHHEARKARLKRSVEQYTEEVADVAEWIDDQLVERYGIGAKQNKHAKEHTNGEREAALEAKAKQSRKAAKKKHAPALMDTYDDEYTRMKEEMYKNKVI